MELDLSSVEVPPYFLCPISLQTMRDPVTLSTGITYDRASIERWIFTDKHQTCPVTKQTLENLDLITPNHTLRRLIQIWCVDHESDGVERFPTPKPPMNKTHVVSILEEAKKPQNTVMSLRKLRALISQSERNKRFVEESEELTNFLVAIVRDYKIGDKNEELLFDEEELESSYNNYSNIACEEALNVLYSLQLSQQGWIKILKKNGDFTEILAVILAKSNYQSRAYAIFLMKSLVCVVSHERMICTSTKLIQEVVRVIHDQVSSKCTKAALQVLYRLGPWGRNRVKTVEAGAVQLLIDLLLDEKDSKLCEIILLILEQLCHCADGRANLVFHGAGLAVVSKKIFRVSHTASEYAVRVLHLVAKYSASRAVLQEMVQLRIVTKLFLVLQMDCSMKAKEKAKEILRLHSKVWRGSPCLSPQLNASYPC